MSVKSKWLFPWLMPALMFALAQPAASEQSNPQPAPNGLKIPKNYKDWPVLSISHRTDKNSLRVILGNSVAIKAARSGQTNPWPDGTILAKLVWKDNEHPLWPAATVPGDKEHIEFMFKDSKRFKANDGWGYARWVGKDQKPYGTNAQFDLECHSCHTSAKESDFVFTRPVKLP